MREPASIQQQERVEMPVKDYDNIGLLDKGQGRTFLDHNERKLRGWNLHVVLDGSRASIVTLDRKVIAMPVEIILLNHQDADEEQGWITARFTATGVEYVLSGNNRIIERRPYTPQEAFEIKQSLDQKAKAVTARGMGAYPYQFQLPFDEVWPKDSDIAVIGDPFQKVNRDRTTIVDYEYADEMLPDIQGYIKKIRSGDPLSKDDLTYKVKAYLNNIFAGNDYAVQTVHGTFTPDDGNPYRLFADRCIELVAEFIIAAATDQAYDRFTAAINILQEQFTRLRIGTWQKEEFVEFCGDDQKALNNLDLFYSIKEESARPTQGSWDAYTNAWQTLLDRLPESVITEMELTQQVQRVRYWITELPRIQGAAPSRIQTAMDELSGLYENIIERAVNNRGVQQRALDHSYREMEQWGGEQSGEKQPRLDEHPEAMQQYAFRYLLQPGISDVRNTGMMSDSPFGLAIPGIPINHRVSGYLADLVDLTSRVNTYVRNILPALQAEENRLLALHIPIDEATKKGYLAGLERHFVREQLHNQRAHRSITIHGYFPDGMKNGLDPQDRIVALYSLSTHVWEQYTGKEPFYADLKKALAYLKPGGSLIVGPINYHAYRVWQRGDEDGMGISMQSSFDGDGLRAACEQLRQEGLMSYEFTKGEPDGNMTRTDSFKSGDVAGALIVNRPASV